MSLEGEVEFDQELNLDGVFPIQAGIIEIGKGVSVGVNVAHVE